MTCDGCGHEPHDAWDCRGSHWTGTHARRCLCDHGYDGQGDLDTDDHQLRIGTTGTDRTAPTWDRGL